MEGESGLMALPPNGTVVKAKRLGWDEELTPEQDLDLEPYEDKEYPSNDLEGELETINVNDPIVGQFTCCLVGGQEADPETVEEL